MKVIDSIEVSPGLFVNMYLKKFININNWIKKIVKNSTPVILCFDEDAKDKTQKIAKMLHEYCVPVKLTQHVGKDFGDMSKEEVNYWLKEAKPFNNVDRISYLIKNIKSGSMY